MTVAAIFFAVSVSAQEVKENSSDTRLMKNVVTLGVLENGMVLHDWEWNDTAIQLSPKYGLSVTEGGYHSVGLIAQDVEAIYPDAVVVDADGYLVIDIPMLAEQDELIAKMVMEGGADVVNEARKGVVIDTEFHHVPLDMEDDGGDYFVDDREKNGEGWLEDEARPMSKRTTLDRSDKLINQIPPDIGLRDSLLDNMINSLQIKLR